MRMCDCRAANPGSSDRRPGLGRILVIKRYELALGDNGRSGEQFDIWQRMHYNPQYLPKMLDRIQKTAPKGADLTSCDIDMDVCPGTR